MKHVLITRQIAAASAAKRWEDQYLTLPDNWGKHDPAKRRQIHKDLVALGSAPNPDDVDRIIGNTSWTDTGSCDACGLDDGSPRVRVGQEPDYESSTASLCLGCLQEAVALLQSGTAEESKP